MLGIEFSLLLFFLCFILHVFLHRMSEALVLERKKTVLVYGIGFVLLLLAVVFGKPELPIVSLLLYMLPSLLISFLYVSRILSSSPTPTHVIVSTLERESVTEKQLIAKFSDAKLIQRHLHDLVITGLLTLRQGRCSVTSRGVRVLRIMEWYQRLLNAKELG